MSKRRLTVKGKIIAGAIGNCVHVAGVYGFLRLADELGYDTEFLGAAVSIDRFIDAIKEHNPDIVGISYRLTPEVGERILNELRSKLEDAGLINRRFAFGGTPPVCKMAEKQGWFERCFSGLENPRDVWAYLSGLSVVDQVNSHTGKLTDRIEQSYPFPLLRHHFGLPNMEETISGVQKIAESGVIDVISIAPDQNAQESFFRRSEMDPMLDGAGGAPIRTSEDLTRIYQASRCGNFPLLRIYSGTRDLIKWADLSVKTINNAWGAVPLCWYSALDGRSKRLPEDAIRENQAAMRWYGEHDIPLEVNEAHHWSMRDAHDTIAVVMAYLAAYNAKAMGVSNYVAQYMFNSPPITYGSMDLAKMLAKVEMIEQLHDETFHSFRQVRAGLLHLSPKGNVAKGQLAASTTLALQLKPHIIHVVGYCEGDHAAYPDDVIESCEIVQGVIRNALKGMPYMADESSVIARKNELLEEANTLLDALRSFQIDMDPLIDPRVLATAIKAGILDAPHLKGNAYAAGRLQTRMIDGAIYAVNPDTKKALTESERLSLLLSRDIHAGTSLNRA